MKITYIICTGNLWELRPQFALRKLRYATLNLLLCVAMEMQRITSIHKVIEWIDAKIGFDCVHFTSETCIGSFEKRVRYAKNSSERLKEAFVGKLVLSMISSWEILGSSTIGANEFSIPSSLH